MHKQVRERASAVVIDGDRLLTVLLEDPTTKSVRHYVPGGAIELGETPAASAARETLEETGYEVRIEGPPRTRDYDFTWDGVTYACRTHFFRGFLAAKAVRPVHDAAYHRGVVWVPSREVPAALGFHPVILEEVQALMLNNAPPGGEAMQGPQEFRSFQEFWPFYVQEHANANNRRLHFVGTALVVLLGVAGLIYGHWWLAVLMPVAGYSFAWVGHFVVQKNRPATFKHPLWSLVGDFKMFGYMCMGRMQAEVERTNNRE